MSHSLLRSLEDVEQRLSAKGLFGHESDSVSLRVPGQAAALFALAGQEPRVVGLDDESFETSALHTRVYRARPDVGGIVVGETMWMSALAALGVALPSLFDEQARHIGRPSCPSADGDLDGLLERLADGGNAAPLGNQTRWPRLDAEPRRAQRRPL